MAIILLSGLLAGCQSATPAVKEPSVHELGLKQWDSTRAAVLLSLAGDQYKTGNFDKCRETIDSGLQLDPNNPAVHLLSARLYIEQGQLELAEKDLDAARAVDPAGAEEDYLSGVIYQRWQQPDKAQWYYDSACKKAPTELAYLMARAEMMVWQGHPAEALALLQTKITYFEHSAAIRDAAGMLLLQQHRPSEAIEMFRRATILSTDDLTLHEHLADALYQDHQFAPAAEELTDLLKNDPWSKRADLYLTLGQCQLNLGRAADARTSLLKASDLDPATGAAWLALAKMAMESGDLHRADYYMGRAQNESADSSESQLMLGYLRLRQDRLDEALAAFGRASQMDSRDTVSLCMMGYILEKQHHSDEAERYFQAALKISPRDQLALELMADAGN